MRKSKAKKERPLLVNGGELTAYDVVQVARDNLSVAIHEKVAERAERSRAFLDERIDKQVIYGVNTGFGPMATRVIGKDQRVELQYNLIRSHAMGMGEPVRADFVRAAMLVRLNTLARGVSGVSPELLEYLALFLNKGIVPIVPEHGAVGTSGDLVQLAHCALACIGEGEVWYKGERMKAITVLRELAIKPYRLRSKEGLALINGTAMMTGVGALIATDAERLVQYAVRAGALALELIYGFTDGLDEFLHELRPHPGQRDVAATMRHLLQSSKRVRERKPFAEGLEQKEDVYRIPESVQEIYSLRCIPQIIGPIFDSVRGARIALEYEMNSVTDNPVIDVDRELFLHGGNFHGDVVSLAIDTMKIGLVKLSMLLERQINFFLDENVNHTFPPFLNLEKPGLTLALQGLQFVATSTTAQNQTLAFPQYVHSIPTNGGNQDVVSMGTDAALLASKVLDNTYTVLAINLVTLAQAVEALRAKSSLSREGRKLYLLVRKYIDPVHKDVSMSKELNAFVEILRDASNDL